MNKYAVVTRAKDNFREISDITHPVLKSYAERCDADFIVISEDKYDLGSFFYEIFQCHELLDTYERLIIIDSDALITPSCPNLFEVVPYDHVGTVYEDKYNRRKDREKWIRKVQEEWGDIGWRNGYINLGLFVCSRCHKDLFDVNKHRLWMDMGYADISFAYYIHQYKYPVYELSYKFNHMSMFSEVGKHWLTSYIIHYAGRGFSSSKGRAEQIKADLELLRRSSNPFLLNLYRVPERIRLLAIGIYNYINA